MKCYNCGADLDDRNQCPKCKTNVRLYKKIVASANVLYNDGLEKARQRDLTGAAVQLQKSLRLFKGNIDARNLLGLIYYEMGEYVAAVAEWNISVALLPQGNDAVYFLDQVLGGSRRDDMQQVIRKYNQAIYYCYQGSYDLAILLLKRVISYEPNFVKAHQLLALVYDQSDMLDEARAQIRIAARIDKNDKETQRILSEISKSRKARGYNRTKKKKDAVSYQNGNETIIQPLTERLKSSPSIAITNMALGLIIGALTVYFLIVPAIRTAALQSANNDVTYANEQLAAQQSNVAALKQQILELEGTVTDYESSDASAAGVVASYRYLVQAQKAYNEGDLSSAKEYLDSINQNVLDDEAMAVFDVINTAAYANDLATMYQNAYNYYNSYDYASAISILEQMLQIDQSYQDGEPWYLLGVCHQRNGDNATAKEVLNSLIETMPNSSAVSNAQQMISYIEMIEAQSNAATQTTTNTYNYNQTTTDTTGTETYYDTTGTGTYTDTTGTGTTQAW